MTRIRAFWDFWYDFIIGDDWRVALGVITALAVTYAVSRTTIAAWWILPLAVAVLLPMSLWRATRHHNMPEPADPPAPPDPRDAATVS